MSRVQLALNVADLDEAVEFYSKLFATEPAKVRPGYANFAVADPPLKLVLIEDATKTPGTLNHLGVEVASTDEVTAAQVRLAAGGLATAVEEQTECCYALQDKVWVDGPGGALGDLHSPGRRGHAQRATPSHESERSGVLRHPARPRRRYSCGQHVRLTPASALENAQ